MFEKEPEARKGFKVGASDGLEFDCDFCAVFQQKAVRLLPLHEFCQEAFKLPKSPLQIVITMIQLLLAHPRDGDFVGRFLHLTGSKSEDTPTRRDLLPFQFCPSVGAALKLVRNLEVSPKGIISTLGGSWLKLGRQQQKKLLAEGTFQLWRWLIMMVLNGEYLDWGIPETLSPSKPSVAQVCAMEYVGNHVTRMYGDSLKEVEISDYNELVRKRTLDYSGDEVSYALPLRLEELLPGLPEASVGGSLEAMEVAAEEVKVWLGDPQKVLKPTDQMPEVLPSAKINATKYEWERLVKVLYDRNILVPIAEKDIFQFKGKPILNGAFAVLKQGTPAEGEEKITRLIMNLTPSNAIQKLIHSDLNTLDGASSWSSIILKESEILLWSGDDQKGAFYAWRLPECWRGLMTFKWPVPGFLVGHPDMELMYVASAVIPMGWLNAVSLFQHIHRRLGLAAWPVGAGFDDVVEWRRDRPKPQDSKGKVTSWIQYYLDDFDTPEVCDKSAAKTLQGHMSDTHTRQRLSYSRQGVGISEKKAHIREPRVVRMGAFVDGLAGTVSAPLEKMWDVIWFAFWIFSQRRPSNKATLMVLGRIVRCFEFRRPLMSVLRQCWPQGDVNLRAPIKDQSLRSILRAVALMPMAVADLRLPVDGLVTSSDASERGGGLCASLQLTDEGKSFLKALQDPSYLHERCSPFRPAGAMPTTNQQGPRIFVLSLFDGVAAIMCALCKLECQIVGFAASEIDKECKKLVRRRWPGVIEMGPVQNIDAKTLETVVGSLGYKVDVVLIPAGSPCQDLSALNSSREGLDGKRSILFYEIPRVFHMAKELFPCPVHLLVENVFSMSEASRLEFNRALGIIPTLIEAHNLTWVRRPRLYWCSWPIEPSSKELLVDYGSYKHWIFPDVKGPPGTWVEDEWIHTGGEPLPTFTRALPRSQPPQNPAGFETASLEARQRWVKDSYRFQVYQYEDNHLLWQGDQWRLPSLLERERLMGFDEQYISGILPPKMSQDMAFNLGCSMIGNTFHVPSLVMLCHSLLFVVTRDSPERDHAKLLECTNVAPAGWTKYPSFVQKMTPSPDTKELVREILRIGDRGGTDIKLDLGIPFRLKAFPRAGVRTSVFQWKIIHGYKWKHSAHINCLELQAFVNSVQWRLRSLTNHRKRVLHLVDSQVVASVVAKGRTSSFRLRKALQRLNTLVLASGLKVAVAYIHSTDNPADIPSRWADKKPKKPNGKSKEKASNCASR